MHQALRDGDHRHPANPQPRPCVRFTLDTRAEFSVTNSPDGHGGGKLVITYAGVSRIKLALVPDDDPPPVVAAPGLFFSDWANVG